MKKKKKDSCLERGNCVLGVKTKQKENTKYIKSTPNFLKIKAQSQLAIRSKKFSNLFYFRLQIIQTCNDFSVWYMLK